MKKLNYLLLIFVIILPSCDFKKGFPKFEAVNYVYFLEKNNRKLDYYDVKHKLTDEVQNYINTVAPSSSVDALDLIDKCNKYNVNLLFVLAQGTMESHFATKGIGGKINNIFNVCVYDSIKDGNKVNNNYRYEHPNESIEPYLILLTENYLVDGKTESDLLENFVNKNGKRYATYVNYENDLISIIKRIKTTTKIDSLNNELIRAEIILL
jgi:flagellum-specific peptidoglycan hydrolase FlgJ